MSGDALDLDALAELEQAATPGPWPAVAGAFGDPANGPDHMRVVREGWSNAHDPEHTVARMEYDQQDGADAALIAALRNAAPALIAAARERDWLDDWRYCPRCGRGRDDDSTGAPGAPCMMCGRYPVAARAEVAALRERVEAVLADRTSVYGIGTQVECLTRAVRAALIDGADQ